MWKSQRTESLAKPRVEHPQPGARTRLCLQFSLAIAGHICHGEAAVHAVHLDSLAVQAIPLGRGRSHPHGTYPLVI